MERLTERDSNPEYGWDIRCRRCDEFFRSRCLQCNERPRLYTRLADYEDAEEQGRLIELPLAYGEHIFEAYENGHKVIEWTVEGFNIKPDSTYICIGHGVSINAAKLGKDLFRTREEAEAKLKEMDGNNDDILNNIDTKIDDGNLYGFPEGNVIYRPATEEEKRQYDDYLKRTRAKLKEMEGEDAD